jgi:glycosyltransferase involved in cell wall biosynthesis
MRILFFTEISPFPVNGGEKIRTVGLLKSLSKSNYKVTAIIQNEESCDITEYMLENVKFIVFNHIKSRGIKRILNTSFFERDKNVIEIFNNEVENNKPDIAILDYYKAGRYYRYFLKKKIPFIIGTHNAEFELLKHKPTIGLNKYFRKIQELIYLYIHEHYFFRYASAIIAVSENDVHYYQRFITKKRIHLIPNFLDEQLYQVTFDKENYFVFTANFEPFMNRMGLKWLIEEVWNRSLSEEVKLILVGKYSKEALKELNKSHNYNIEALGEVKQVIPYIRKAKAVIIPLLHGSGTRLKCLEAMALKTQIISTSKGCEGINSDNVIIANTSEEFRSRILDFKIDKKIGEKLHQEFINEYSLKANIQRIKNLVESTDVSTK